MALRPILRLPNHRLRLKAQPVTQFDAALLSLVRDLYDTMYASAGIGLAASQIDVQQRVITIDLSDRHDQPLTLINVEILAKHGEQTCEEGCLSVPGVYAPVTRAKEIRVKTQDIHGDTSEFDADGMLAVCIQHELDHLEGKVFIDYLSPLKRERLLAKMTKHLRETL